VRFDRWYTGSLRKKLKRPYVHLIFGARQTGKSTLVGALLPGNAVQINLADPAERSRHLADPGEFARICRSIPSGRSPRFVFVDEAQSVPSIFDAVQSLYDAESKRWRFILCGSSARKLRATGTNLLPGRSFVHHLFPLTVAERPTGHSPKDGTLLPLAWPSGEEHQSPFPATDLIERLAFGELPGIAAAAIRDRADILRAYTLIHLEEEIRREAMVKDWGAFVRFLHLAAAESGKMLNYTNLSQESGVSQPTIKTYYQLLQDMFVGFLIPAYSRSPRKNLLSTPRFLFFDLGVRHAAAGLLPSTAVARTSPGEFFEQWVGIELWKRLNYIGTGRLFYLRTRDGAEVDYIVEHGKNLIPLEVKWTEHPTMHDARHLLTFLQENPGCNQGYIICRCPRPLRIHEQITALPWFCF